MEIRSSLKTANYARKLFFGETDNILPFDIRIQKPRRTGKMPQALPCCAPEEQGVSAAVLDSFLRELAACSVSGVQGVMVLRGGKMICDARFAPYSTDYWHITHSLCKSVTGTAIGMLMDEGLLTADENICAIFPDKCNLLTGKRTRSLTVRHLLTMTSGVNFKEAGAVLEKDWVKAYLDADMLFEPGTQFDYNSMNSYVLSAIIKRKTGKGLMDYLTPRLFTPLGFGDVAWETCPLGIEKGGWGMYVHLEDMAKLGQLYLQKGKWTVAGKSVQLISERWIDKATTAHATNPADGMEYGYQLWVDPRDKSYAFNGLFGQYVQVYPKQDIVVAMISSNECLFVESAAHDTVRKYFSTAEHLSCLPLPKNVQAERALRFTMEHLRFRQGVPPLPRKLKWYEKLFPQKSNTSVQQQDLSVLSRVDGKKYYFRKNHASMLPIIMQLMNDFYSKGFTEVWFEKSEEKLIVHWKEGVISYRLPVGFGTAEISTLVFGGNEFAIAVEGKFVTDEDDEPVLKLHIMPLESSNTRTVKFFFRKDGTLEIRFDEHPAVMDCAEALAKTNPTAISGINIGTIRDRDYLEFLIAQVFCPTIKSIDKEKEESSAEITQSTEPV